MTNQRKQQPEKISADCPHCGFSQLESAYAKSTICRRCSQPYSIEKLLAKEVSSLRPPSILERFGKLITRETIREISCFSCLAKQQVSTSAESSLCPKCGSYIDLRDFKITGPFGRSIQTQGEVIITQKADVSSQRILCGSAWVEGKLRGQLLCTDTVHINVQGKFSGSIDSEKVIVERRSETEFMRPLKARSIEVNGKATGEIHCDGKVTINKHGRLEGAVHARSILVEKGGIFTGNLHISTGAGNGEKLAAAAAKPTRSGNVGKSAAEAAAADLPGFNPEALKPPAPPAPRSKAGERRKNPKS